MKGELLGENPNDYYTSGTININMSSYPVICIAHRSENLGSIPSYTMIPVSVGLNFYLMNQYTVPCRPFSITSLSQLTVSASGQNKGYNFPVKIYGIK